jgi:hypothetical protein
MKLRNFIYEIGDIITYKVANFVARVIVFLLGEDKGVGK